ncbi:MAG: hypothetical protein R3275_08925 [Saprospiraceae bacterium]|nr:hypothetical protein [Saprospiraceae bacterium]
MYTYPISSFDFIQLIKALESVVSIDTFSLFLSLFAVFISFLGWRARVYGLDQVDYDCFQKLIRELVDITNEWDLLQRTPLKRRDQSFEVRLNCLNVKRAYIADNIGFYEKRFSNRIPATQYSELAKTFYALFDLERAEEYHKKAYQKSGTDALGLAVRRSYADFLFLQGDIKQGRKMYEKSRLDNSTDINIQRNIKSYGMQLYNEASAGNITEAAELYRRGMSCINEVKSVLLANRMRDSLNSKMKSAREVYYTNYHDREVGSIIGKSVNA